MTYQIEKGIPIPEAHRHTRSIYPFSAMEVDDSFPVPLQGETAIKVQCRVTSAIASFRKNNKGKNFVTRFVREESLVRVWRVE